jgi:hypothetical protein
MAWFLCLCGGRTVAARVAVKSSGLDENRALNHSYAHLKIRYGFPKKFLSAALYSCASRDP